MGITKNDQGKVLLTASLTEFGERYSYYVIQALLIFFLIQKFHISQDVSSELVGTVLSMVYISAIVSGYIADKLIGYYVAAFLGSILLILGTLILSVSSTENLLFLGLSFIAISTGLIKSNMSSFLGSFYDRSKLGQGYRDFGFNIFYVGINLGSLFALFFASSLKNHYGFATPFYSCVIVAIIIMLNISIGFITIKEYTGVRKINKGIILKTISLIVGYIIIVYIILKNPTIANISIFVAIALSFFIIAKSAKVSGWNNPLIAVFFYLVSIIYWCVYFQIFISVLLFTNNCVSHQFFSVTITDSQFLSIESLAVIVLGTIMGRFWLYLSRVQKTIHDIDKFNVGLFLIAVVFAVLYLATVIGAADAKVPAFVFVVSYVLLAISELCLSAIGLSLITKIAPEGFVSLYMGIWLVTLGVGGKLAGLVSKNITINNDVISSKISMAHGFLQFIVIALIGVVFCFLLRKKIKANLPQT